ncbi:hypothetical protein CEXT_539981 [Caerostris extrusa]|uniref:Uncharacterized protein n=1 Tax=Caerostris extrusa TaxID=172846 RepID=A0AAV4MLC2_CAEEX|nr:hypothetical protein CEXT_539981 [Caerostris extrusa]
MNLSLTSVDIGSVHLPSNLSVGNNTFCKKQVERGVLAVSARNLESFLRPNKLLANLHYVESIHCRGW